MLLGRLPEFRVFTSMSRPPEPNMVTWFFSAIPYIFLIATITAGGVDLYRKREELKSRWQRTVVVVLFILVGILSLLSLYHDNREKQQAGQKAEQEIQGLNEKLDLANTAQQTAIQDQRENTKIFADQFQKLSDELGDLKTQVKTEALQKKLVTVQTELEKTQKALAPGPKARLQFTFVPFVNPPNPKDAVLITDVTLPVSKDGIVHIEFNVVNLSDADAVDGDVVFQIPDKCKFAKEPEGLIRVRGAPDTQRDMAFRYINRMSMPANMAVDVIVPAEWQFFAVGITYRCRTCVLNTDLMYGTIHLNRP
jgi:hypothetical protein